MRGAVAERWAHIERYAPWLVLAVSLAVTYFLWQNAHGASIQAHKSEFNSRVSDISDRIHRRITYYEQVLHGIRAFYLNQHAMEQGEFHGYLAALELEKNFPGMQGISFAPLVTDAHKAAHIAAVRRDGLPDYTIRPEGRRPSYAPVAYIEPLTVSNHRVLGFDNLTSPVRKALLERARDEDHAIISETLVLKQDDAAAPQTGFLMFLPVFRRVATHDTLTSRREHIEGWFAASFRMRDFMDAVLDARAKGLDIAIFDGDVPSEQNRLYGSLRQTDAAFTETALIEVPGRKWTVQFRALPEFEAERDASDEMDDAGAGIVLSLLLALITWLLMRDRQRVVHMHSTIGRELEMRQQAEYRVQDLHLFNQAILDKSPAGIAVFMRSGACVMANAAYARSIGGSVEEVLKQNFRYNESWQRNGLLDYAEQAFDSGLTIRRDIEGETSFNKRVVLECIFAPIAISGRPHLLLIVNDISARTEAEHALTESMRMLEDKELAKTRFLAAAGHDLRQPMAAASLFIDALKMTGPSPQQQEIIARLDQSMATFNSLLDALLNVSKLDAGMIKPELTAIHVTELFNWLEQNFAPMAMEKRLGFRLYFPMREALVVCSDIGLIKSVLMNLVSNAIKFTERGAVLICARRRGTEVLFQVWDSGIGIAEENIAHIFDEFYQINNPQRDRSSGLGLGLSIAKRALTLLGTEIVCRSRLGRGSVFEFRLPLDNTVQAHAVAAPSPVEVVNDLFARGQRFVVVEDDNLVAQAMVSWLEGIGGEVRCFHSAEDALRHAGIEQADYYIADYMLGGELNGIQFLNRVRQERGKPIKAVLVTGDTSTAFIRHAVECDWPVLHKPINTSKLIAALSARAQGPVKPR